MNISFAGEKDTEAVRFLWEECFGDTPSYIDAYFSAVYKPSCTLVARDGDKVVGALQMLPRPLSVNGIVQKSAYIGGVSVLPSHRLRGIASALMRAAEAHLEENGYSLAFLVPFRFSFYEKLGYSCMSFLSEFSGEISALAPFVSLSDKVRPVLGQPLAAYNAFAAKSALYMERTLTLYENEFTKLSENSSFVSLSDDSGYLLYTTKEDTLFVLEIAYKNEEALRALLGFIYAQHKTHTRFCIRTAASGDMRKLLCENTILESRYPHSMVKALVPIDLPDSMDAYINMIGWF